VEEGRILSQLGEETHSGNPLKTTVFKGISTSKAPGRPVISCFSEEQKGVFSALFSCFSEDQRRREETRYPGPGPKEKRRRVETRVATNGKCVDTNGEFG